MVSTVQEKPAQSGKSEQAPGILLLPSHFFFVRTLVLPAGINPEELPSFVELSLEQISPFALNQLFYGYYLPADSSRLLVYAAYRKQLSVAEDDEWAAPDLVLPRFASVLGLPRNGPTLAFLQDGDELTAIYWSAGSEAPDRILSRRIDPEGEVPVERARDELRRKIGAVPDRAATVLLTSPEGKMRDRNLVFDLVREGQTESISTEIARPIHLPMDIRDKAFLNATRKVQRQNRWLWASVLAVCAMFVALAVFEAALFAGNKVLDTREARIHSLEPEVAKIRGQEDLANRLDELSGERLLPFEMLVFLNEVRPRSIYYDRVATNGLHSFQIAGFTPRSEDVDRFQRALEQADSLETVEIRDLQTRADLSSFTLAGTFRAGALNSISSAAPREERVAIPELPEGILQEGDIQMPVRNGSPGELPVEKEEIVVRELPEEEPRDEPPGSDEETHERATSIPDAPSRDLPVDAGAEEGDEEP